MREMKDHLKNEETEKEGGKDEKKNVKYKLELGEKKEVLEEWSSRMKWRNKEIKVRKQNKTLSNLM